jgi:hypothetical protein
MDGKESIKDVPNDDEGLKALIPPKPVDCDCSFGDGSEVLEVVVLDDLFHDNASENAEPLDVVEVFCAPRNDDLVPVENSASAPVLFPPPNANDDATFPISDPGSVELEDPSACCCV